MSINYPSVIYLHILSVIYFVIIYKFTFVYLCYIACIDHLFIYIYHLFIYLPAIYLMVYLTISLLTIICLLTYSPFLSTTNKLLCQVSTYLFPIYISTNCQYYTNLTNSSTGCKENSWKTNSKVPVSCWNMLLESKTHQRKVTAKNHNYVKLHTCQLCKLCRSWDVCPSIQMPFSLEG